MKRFLPLLALAFVAPSFSRAVQAQAETPGMAAAPNRDDSPAMAILDQSAAAYKALNGLSMRFSATDVQGEKTTTMSGTIAVERPGKARISVAKSATPFLTDSAAAKTAEDATKMLQMAMARIPSGASVPLVFLIAGQNPLADGSAFGTTLKWSGVTLLPDNGVSMTTSFGAGASAQPIKFDLYFDPNDHLLRRVEAKGLKTGPKGQKLLNISTFSAVQINPTFAADTFTKPAATPTAAK